MAYKVEQIPNSITKVGEGPHWDIETRSLYYVDVYGGSVCRYDYSEKKLYSAKIEGVHVVCFIIPIEGIQNKFAIGVDRRVGVIDWDGKSSSTKVEKFILEVDTEDELKHNRFNDAKADPQGRFFGGTIRLEEGGDIFASRLGNFYTHSPGNPAKLLLTKLGLSNGLTWNESTNKMYFIDSCDFDVKEFDYDPRSGHIKNQKQLIDFRINGERPNFVPDGMAIDDQGYLYVATFGGSAVLKVNTSTKAVEDKIQIPTEQITSCAFGGPNLDVLFVTSASIGGKPEPAGATFIVTGLGVKGTKMHKLRI